MLGFQGVTLPTKTKKPSASKTQNSSLSPPRTTDPDTQQTKLHNKLA